MNIESYVAIAILFTLPALGQNRKDPVTANYGNCGAANGSGPNSTNYYGSGDPCKFVYSVPADRLNQLLNDVPYCSMYSRTQVVCSQAIKGQYGQIALDRRDGAGAGGGKGPGSAPGLSQPSSSPTAVSPAQPGNAEQLWQRAVELIDRNNHRDAIPLLLQAGRLGHARAQSTLGIAYQDGNGVRADDRAAAYWFGLAAAQGHRAAQYALGGMYEEGEGGLSKDQAKATALYIKSASQGFDKAQLALGICYELGQSVTRDRAKAIALIRQSGLAREIADVLANPRTPKAFPNEAAFVAYLNSLRSAQMARARGGMRPAGNRIDPYFDPNSDYNRLKRWESRPRCENSPCKN
jgi:hypothetical protein